MVKVREYSYMNAPILEALKQKAIEWEKLLIKNCIFPKEIFVWIKEFQNKYYLKLEIDACDQEIQYELSCSSDVNSLISYTINETHFKNFYHNGTKWVREDLPKEKACPTIRAIDDIILDYERKNNPKESEEDYDIF